MVASTRRAALGAILAAPLASVPVAASSASPSLANLVARYERLDALLQAESDRLEKAGWRRRNDMHDRLAAVCGKLRGRICQHPSTSMDDVLLKVRAFALSTSFDDGREELECNLQSRDGHAYLDDIALAVIVNLVGLREGKRCA